MTTYIHDDNGVIHVRGASPGTVCCGRSGQGRTLGEFPGYYGTLCPMCALYMLPEVKVNGYHLPTLARLARALHSPIDDGLAELIWHMSNTDMPYSFGADFLRACGYVPFQGFPLVRLKTPDMEGVTKP